MKKICTILVCLLAAVLPAAAAAETVVVEAGRDATLIEDSDGARANGSGPYLFAGRTSQQQNGIRRGLVYFDVAAVLPRHAIIESVELRLTHSGGNAPQRSIQLHRMQADWNEGPAYASGGGGAPSGFGDTTWLHTFYDATRWVRPGGHYVGRASASQDVGPGGRYAWASTVHLVQDVRLWLAAPQRNFGWMLIGDESTPQNAKRIASRENPDPTIRPRLEIHYRLPGLD
jgi:hypothetical protein